MPGNQIQLLALPWTVWMIGLEAQAVIGMRMLGMAGFWSVDRHENTRMINEKLAAFTAASLALQQAMLTGRAPDIALQSALRPVRRKTRNNHRRLARRGPRLRGHN